MSTATLFWLGLIVGGIGYLSLIALAIGCCKASARADDEARVWHECR